MSYRVIATPEFEKDLKLLSKKHVSLKADLQSLINSLKENPNQGTSPGNNTYKIRLSITSKRKVRAAAQELSLMFLHKTTSCFSSAFTINLLSKLLVIVTSKNG